MPETLSGHSRICRSSAKAHALIKEFEQCRLTAYLCPAGKPTIGWGHTKGVRMGDRINLEQAHQFFEQDIREFDAGVASLVTVPLKQHQFDALVSFAYNTGLDVDADEIAEGLGDSSLLKLVNAGNFVGASKQFQYWVSGGRPKKRLGGLVRRRKKEKALFLGEYEV